ncbi:GntR family transcriptional regulator [Acuticoccus sp. MNP-M23]|uniref:GntR family transcriptional regulator n=1 Tax=Acuticoccus sp. MNP-M23 TaxID=3072793 RepID=UPI0028152132|nr:GntR family transcriptional regulator [Acuticoccus sp. MNP-M23]WMS40952.1 GntR family transcriptional regulator [Acuticoccus sp. MNP-M23]
MSAALRSDGARASAGVYDDVRRRIIMMELPPGTTLDRSELAERYKVSQSPVREAMRRLEQDGLVQAFPQSRTVVTRIDVSRIEEEHFHRVALECEVVLRLAARGGAASLVTPSGLVRTQEALVGDVGQIDLFRQLDDAFHESLFGALDQLGLYRHIRSRAGQLARVRTLDLPSDGKMRAVLNAHLEILAALEAGDGEGARHAMRRHLSGTVERLPALRLEHPAFFIGG